MSIIYKIGFGLTVVVVAACGSSSPKPDTTAPPSTLPAVSTPSAKPSLSKTVKPPAKSTTRPPANDPRFDTCAKAKAAGYGPYTKGVDPEYAWYRDGDNDGTVCE